MIVINKSHVKKEFVRPPLIDKKITETLKHARTRKVTVPGGIITELISTLNGFEVKKLTKTANNAYKFVEIRSNPTKPMFVAIQKNTRKLKGSKLSAA